MMAKEYIEREALLKAMCPDLCNIEYNSGCVECAEIQMIRAFPAADVAPVVHGQWMKTEEPLGWQEVDCIECSACHESWIADEDYGLEFADYWKYCPNCGARMDGE